MTSTVDSMEEPAYLEFSGAHLYTVMHSVPDPVARILLIGPFASERHFSYIPWARWARFLAARRVESLRFDYRGVGESTGSFAELSFGDWSRDVEFLAGWLKRRSPEVPVVLHGLELGALLAREAFASNLGEALLLWAAPTNANEVLRRALLRQIASDNAFKGVSEPTSMSDYLRRLELEEYLDVEGYRWSNRLWNESFKFQLPLGRDEQHTVSWASGRPVRSVALDMKAAPLVKGSSLAYLFLNPDLGRLFTDNVEWIISAISSERMR